MKRVFFVLLSVLVSVMAFAQAPDTLWTRTYETGSTDGARAVIRTEDNGFLIAGRSRLTRIDSSGNNVWSRTLPLSGGRVIDAMANTSDGTVYVLANGGSWLFKLDSSGDTLWTRKLQTMDTQIGSGPLYAGPHCLLGASDGGCIIGGTFRYHIMEDPYWGYDFYSARLEKRDAAGHQVWIRTFRTNCENIDAVRAANDSGFILAGHSGNILVVMKTNAEGIQQWERGVYRLNLHSWNSSSIDVVQSRDGGYAIICEPTDTVSVNVLLVRLNSVGDTLWTRRYPDFYGGPTVRDIRSCTDHGFLIAGSRLYPGFSTGDFLILKTDDNGDTLWTRTWGTRDNDVYYASQITSDLGCILVGASNNHLYAIRSTTFMSMPYNCVEGLDASADGEHVLISFATEGEVNIRSFELYRSDFDTAHYEKIADINAIGDSQQGHAYSFTDSAIARGTKYSYRVTIRDDFGSQFVMGNQVVATHLCPTEITSFDVSVQEQRVVIRLSTAFQHRLKSIRINRHDFAGNVMDISYIQPERNSSSLQLYEAIDTTAVIGRRYWYTPETIDSSDDIDSFDSIVDSAMITYQPPIVYSYSLSVFPNPFNSGTTLTFSVAKSERVYLKLYDVLGRVALTVASGIYRAGEYHVYADASELPSGIYFARLETSSEVFKTQKMVLLK